MVKSSKSRKPKGWIDENVSDDIVTAEIQQAVSTPVEPVVEEHKPVDTCVATQKKAQPMSEVSLIEYSEDLANAEAPAPLPEGDYAVEIRGAEKKTSAKGGTYLSATMFIAPEQYPADYTDGDPDGTSLSYNRVQVEDTQRGRYRMRKFLEAVGAPLSSKLDVNSLIGLTAILTVKHEEYEGETRAQAVKIKEA